MDKLVLLMEFLSKADELSQRADELCLESLQCRRTSIELTQAAKLLEQEITWAR